MEMRLPGFTAELALGNSRRRYYQTARAVAGTHGAVLPAANPSGGGGGGIKWGGPPQWLVSRSTGGARPIRGVPGRWYYLGLRLCESQMCLLWAHGPKRLLRLL